MVCNVILPHFFSHPGEILAESGGMISVISEKDVVGCCELYIFTSFRETSIRITILKTQFLSHEGIPGQNAKTVFYICCFICNRYKEI